MMDLFDTSVLIKAHREDQKNHAFYRELVEQRARRDEDFALSSLVASNFVQIVTHADFPMGPTPLPQALSVIESLEVLPHCHWVAPGRKNWALTAGLCRECACRGKMVTKAHHASIAIEHACNWITEDRDFQVFDHHGLRLTLVQPPSSN